MGLKIPGFEGLDQDTLDRMSGKQPTRRPTPDEPPKVCDQGFTHEEFEELLDNAEYCAKTRWEIDFVVDMVDRFEYYGVNAFLSNKQLSVLMKITGEE